MVQKKKLVSVIKKLSRHSLREWKPRHIVKLLALQLMVQRPDLAQKNVEIALVKIAMIYFYLSFYFFTHLFIHPLWEKMSIGL